MIDNSIYIDKSQEAQERYLPDPCGSQNLRTHQLTGRSKSSTNIEAGLGINRLRSNREYRGALDISVNYRGTHVGSTPSLQIQDGGCKQYP